MKFAVSLIALCCLITCPANAQVPSVMVRVRVVQQNEGIPGADVQLGRVRVLTNSRGVAVIRATPGSRALQIRRIGFAPFTGTLVVPARDTTVVVELEEVAEEVEGIVVLSTRADKRIEEEPVRVEVIAAEEIEEKTMMTPGDIAMLLNETGGLRVQVTTPSLAAANVRVQGLRGRYTLLLADGLPLYGGQPGGLGLLQIPPVDLGQVEIIKGAASALYGASALGGVINLISRKPDGTREVLLNQTSLDGSDAVVWASGAFNDNWEFSFTGGAHRQARADIDDDGWADVPEYQRAVVRPRLFWTSPAGHSGFFTAGATIEDRSGGAGETTSLPLTNFVEALETLRADAGGVVTLALPASRIMSFRASGMTQMHEHVFGTTIEDDRHSTGFLEATLRGLDSGHTWLIGAAFQHDAYAADDVSGFDYNYSVPSVFAQDEIALTEKLTISGSLRYDYHNRYGSFVTPRLSALHRPAEGWSLRASLGSAYFAPTPFTEETEAIGLSGLEPLTDVDAETALSGTIDINHVFGSFELNATVFASRLKDALRLEAAQNDRLILANAPDETRTAGTELLLRFHTEGYHVTATHTFLRATEPGDADGTRRVVPLTPRHAIGLVGMRELAGQGRFAVEFYYTGRQELDDNPYRTRSKSYLVFGLLGEWRFGPARVFLNAENLLDARQTRYDPLVRPTRSIEGRWTVDAWSPLEGRVFNLGTRIQW